MQTVQMTLDEDLVAEVDAVVTRLGTSRSAFARAALRQALTGLRELELEQRHREGYRRHPVQPGELSDWEDEQIWID